MSTGKAFLLTTLLLLLVLTSCVKPSIPDESFTYGNTLLVNLVEYVTGPVAAGVAVAIFDGESGELIGEGVTNESGQASIELVWYLEESTGERAVTIVASKENMAKSAMMGLKVPLHSLSEPIDTGPVMTDMVIRRAMVDPESSRFPNLDIVLSEVAGEATDTTGLSVFKVKLDSDQEYDSWFRLYVGLGYVPWEMGYDFMSANRSEITFTVSSNVYSGELPVHVVVYDFNRARLDQVIYLNLASGETTQVEKVAPSGLSVLSITSDTRFEYCSLFEEASEELRATDEEEYGEAISKEETNIYIKLSWKGPQNEVDLAGYNVYRSVDGVTYRKVAFRKSSNFLDPGIGVEVGKRYYYKVRSLYLDGSESEDSNVASFGPLDVFKVKLVSPSNNSTGVSRRPVLRWAPVDKKDHDKVPVLGGGLLNENEIVYHYTCMIWDTVQSGPQLIFPLNRELERFDFVAEGPRQVSVKFLDLSWSNRGMDWFFLLNTEMEMFPFDRLEAFKTYEWGLDYAYACYTGDDGDGNGSPDSMVYSVTIDKSDVVDLRLNHADYLNRFTTGQDN
jgi:hypothetical protein